MGLHTPTILLTRGQLRSEEVGDRVMFLSQGRVAREVRERREEEVLEEAREDNEGEEFLFKWVTTVLTYWSELFVGEAPILMWCWLG